MPPWTLTYSATTNQANYIYPVSWTDATNCTQFSYVTLSSSTQTAYPPEARDTAPAEARQKAKELLLDHLSPEQQHQYEEHGYFDVPADREGDTWRIRGYAGVYRIAGDQEIEKWCIHVPSGYAEADCQLAQLVALLADSEGFFHKANRHWRHEREAVPA